MVSQGSSRLAALARQYRRFVRAARRADAKAVTSLIRDYPDLHNYERGNGSLVEILHGDAPALLEAAFQAGLSPDAGAGPPHQTLLQHAAGEGNLDLLRLLIRYGANPEGRNDWGEVALGYACSWGQLEAVKILVEAGADVNAIEEGPETRGRSTPLDSTRNHPEIAEYLRSKGAKYLSEIEGNGEDGQAEPAGERPGGTHLEEPR